MEFAEHAELAKLEKQQDGALSPVSYLIGQGLLVWNASGSIGLYLWIVLVLGCYKMKPAAPQQFFGA